MAAFHLYSAYAIVPTQVLRPVHVAFVLFLCFLVFPVTPRFRHRVMWWDWLAAALAIAVVVYSIAGGDDFTDRNTSPLPWDIAFGIGLIVLVLEAMRRTSGWIMPVITLAFIAYALAGPYLPAPWTHKGLDLGRIVGHMYMTLEGIFGVAIDVSSSLIILFTIYGAFLQYSGAGKFFIDFSFAAMGGKPTGAGRTVVLASFLLGGPSGSGVATTVTLGAVAYPLLEKVGYEKNAAGGLLAAGGLGAIISPPVLGAAAFLIAEFLKISYLDVLLMACIPTLLFYLALFLMVEIDARKYGMRDVAFERVDTVWNLSKRYWFHFLSLISIVAFMLWGFSPVLSVFWATVVALVTSMLRPETALFSYDLFRGKGSVKGHLVNSGFAKAMEGGAIGMLNVGASYIICAVIAAPALIKLGVPDFAAHMFIFYYAVLSEVSPPTALSPFAAAAITGGDPYKTTMQCWKYTVPAFLLPFMFVLDPAGQGLLLMGSTKALADANWWSIGQVTVTAALGIAAIAGGFQGWALRRANMLERCMLIVAGVALVYPGGIADAVGLSLIVAVLAMQRFMAAPSVALAKDA